MILYKDFANNVKKCFETSNYDERRWKIPLPVQNCKKAVGLMVDERGENITNLEQQNKKHIVIE